MDVVDIREFMKSYEERWRPLPSVSKRPGWTSIQSPSNRGTRWIGIYQHDTKRLKIVNMLDFLQKVIKIKHIYLVD